MESESIMPRKNIGKKMSTDLNIVFRNIIPVTLMAPEEMSCGKEKVILRSRGRITPAQQTRPSGVAAHHPQPERRQSKRISNQFIK